MRLPAFKVGSSSQELGDVNHWGCAQKITLGLSSVGPSRPFTNKEPGATEKLQINPKAPWLSNAAYLTALPLDK